MQRPRTRRATSIRIPRPCGGVIVLRANEESPELPAFFDVARSWFAERAAGDVEHDLELALESVEQHARTDIESFVSVASLPALATQIAVAEEPDDRHAPRMRAVDGNVIEQTVARKSAPWQLVGRKRADVLDRRTSITMLTTRPTSGSGLATSSWRW